MTAHNITLKHAASGAEAEILVSLGFNCHRLKLLAQGEPVEVIWATPEFASGTVRPSRCGIPILFPFPGRIPGTTFEWAGKTYNLEPSDPFGNAIHGFAFKHAWKVLEHEDNVAIAQFDSREDASLAERWPAAHVLTARYELCADTLEMEFTIHNPSASPLPFGLGLHPYFKLPLGSQSAPSDCQITLPIAAEWELKDMLPTGKKHPLANAHEWQAGRAFTDLTLDNVFTELVYEPAGGRSTIEDQKAGRKVHIEYDAIFREIVAFTPPHREAICIEPYTCLPGAVVFEPQDIDAGLCVLPAGDSCVARVAISVE